MCPKPRSTSCWAGVGSSLYRRPTLALALPPPPVFLFAIVYSLPRGYDRPPGRLLASLHARPYGRARRFTTALKDGALRRGLSSGSRRPRPDRAHRREGREPRTRRLRRTRTPDSSSCTCPQRCSMPRALLAQRGPHHQVLAHRAAGWVSSTRRASLSVGSKWTRRKTMAASQEHPLDAMEGVLAYEPISASGRGRSPHGGRARAARSRGRPRRSGSRRPNWRPSWTVPTRARARPSGARSPASRGSSR